MNNVTVDAIAKEASMTNLKIPRRVLAGFAVLCTATLAACDRSAELTTPTIAPVSLPASTTAETTKPTTVAPTTAAPTTVAPTTGAPTTATPATPAPTAATTVPAATDATLAPVPDQHQAIQYDHPTLGPMTITLAYPPRTDTTLINATVRATVNATGEVVFEATDDYGYYAYNFAGTEIDLNITNPVDKRGHVFFEWDYGRYPGVSFLVPTETGFLANGAIDNLSSDYYYLAKVVDPDGDGNYEIDKGFEVCTTSCADGYYYTYAWTWDGSDYSGPDTDPGPDGGADVVRLPGEPEQDF